MSHLIVAIELLTNYQDQFFLRQNQQRILSISWSVLPRYDLEP